MQLGSEGAIIPLPAVGLQVGSGQSHAGGPGKFNFYCSKATDWHIIYSLLCKI